MPNRSRDWMRRAQRDLEQTSDSVFAGRHEWGCFAATRPPEKGLKQFIFIIHKKPGDMWLESCSRNYPARFSVPIELFNKARVLDAVYIPTRYPNGHFSGAIFEHYRILQSKEAIQYAGEIIEFCRSQMA